VELSFLGTKSALHESSGDVEVASFRLPGSGSSIRVEVTDPNDNLVLSVKRMRVESVTLEFLEFMIGLN
jgi:hypothetical protein